jgi:hypothetical protein
MLELRRGFLFSQGDDRSLVMSADDFFVLLYDSQYESKIGRVVRLSFPGSDKLKRKR